MLGMNKKKIATIIMARIKPKSEVEEDFVQKVGEPGYEKEMPDMPMEDESSMGMEMAAEDLLKSIESKDAKGIVSAICAIMDMYEASEDEMEESMEE